jgi:hypothetical protein
MTFPNLLAIILLSGLLKKLTEDYFAIDHREYSKIKDKVTDWSRELIYRITVFSGR